MEIEAIFKLISIILLFAVLITAAVTDLLHRKVYNWTTLPAIALGLALGYGIGGLGTMPGVAGAGSGFLDHMSGMLLGFGVFWGWHLITGGKAVGLGDVKLMAAVGALTGFHFTVSALFWGTLVGALVAMWTLLWRGALLKGLRRSVTHTIALRAPEELPEDDPAKVRIPYGVALSFGTMLAWFLVALPKVGAS